MSKKKRPPKDEPQEHTYEQEQEEQARLLELDAAVPASKPSRRLVVAPQPVGPPAVANAPEPAKRGAEAIPPAPAPPARTGRVPTLNDYGYPIGVPRTAEAMQQRADILAEGFAKGTYDQPGTPRYKKALHHYKASLNAVRLLGGVPNDRLGVTRARKTDGNGVVMPNKDAPVAFKDTP